MKYPTERDVRKAGEAQLSALNAGTLGGKVAATLGNIVDCYLVAEFPVLRHSTQTALRSLIDLHLKPKWQDMRLADVAAIAVKQWMEKLPFGAGSKVRARNRMSELLDLAMLWEYIPVNPMERIRVQGSKKRQKQITMISPAQFKEFVNALPEPYNLMVLVTGCLGLRVSETLGLKWNGFNLDECTLSIGRVFTHGQVQNIPKTNVSGGEIPVPSELCEILKEWKGRQQHEHSWTFASLKTGNPLSDTTILNNYLKPAAVKPGIQGPGWHSLRHSYKS